MATLPMSGMEDFRIVRSTLEAAWMSCLLGLVRASIDTSIRSALSSGVRYFLKNWEKGSRAEPLWFCPWPLHPGEAGRSGSSPACTLGRPAGLGPARPAPGSPWGDAEVESHQLSRPPLAQQTRQQHEEK